MLPLAKNNLRGARNCALLFFVVLHETRTSHVIAAPACAPIHTKQTNRSRKCEPSGNRGKFFSEAIMSRRKCAVKFAGVPLCPMLHRRALGPPYTLRSKSGK